MSHRLHSVCFGDDKKQFDESCDHYHKKIGA